MKILLTGASSFTGYWFAQALSAAGHEVVAPLRGTFDSGRDAERGERLRRLFDKVTLIPQCRFGGAVFLDLVRSLDFDVLCHHAAEVGDYHDPEFDITTAAAKNTFNLRAVLAAMSGRGLKGMVLTGTFFEPDEGAGSQPLVAFSPYGVSKGLTAQIVRHRCHEASVPLGKFVIPHPFGPLEQPRLGAYLARTWAAGGTAEIKTPDYIRDNIHVGLLAACYQRFVEHTEGAPAFRKLNPSGYVESQGAFVERVAREVGSRTGRVCAVKLLPQKQFFEPVMRVNIDPAMHYAVEWDETATWDEYSDQFNSLSMIGSMV